MLINMALNDDSPPFAVLQQSAEDFKTAFDTDISNCLNALNSKITSLMCDPDSLERGSGQTKRCNAHVEFSMAKYAILAGMKALYEEAEKRWVARLEDMKEEFIENVEVFLANTKLEVKLPMLGVSPRAGIINSPTTPIVSKQNAKSPVVSSLYPKLFNSAKSIPVLSSLLPKHDEDEEEESSEEEDEPPQPSPVKTVMPTARTPKKVSFSKQYILSPGQNGTFRTRGNQSVADVSIPVYEVDEESEEEEEEPIVVVQTPVKRSVRGRKYIANTPASAKKETVRTPIRRKAASKNESDSASSNEEKAAPAIETGRRGRRSVMVQPAVETVVKPTPVKRGRTPRKKANERKAEPQPDEDVMEINEVEYESAATGQKTPKQVHFALGLDPNEDLEIYSPEVNISRSVPRRKTMITQAVDNISAICLTPEVTRGKSKRKTFAGSQLDQSVAPSPKRLKRGGGRSSLAPFSSEMNCNETNFLESEGASEISKYSPWIPLSDIGATVPAQPGIYELKVAQAKKPAYIGASESLRHNLTLHKLAQNTGHKHLDKFVERNCANILVRYEKMASAVEAKAEEKNRMKDFVACYKTTPAYN